MPKINIDQFAIEVMQELDAYREDVQEAVEKAVKETAKQTAAEYVPYHRKEIPVNMQSTGAINETKL